MRSLSLSALRPESKVDMTAPLHPLLPLAARAETILGRYNKHVVEWMESWGRQEDVGGRINLPTFSDHLEYLR